MLRSRRRRLPVAASVGEHLSLYPAPTLLSRRQVGRAMEVFGAGHATDAERIRPAPEGRKSAACWLLGRQLDYAAIVTYYVTSYVT